MDEAVRELRALAAGHNDVLASAAGITAGAWFADPGTCTGVELAVAGLLIQAGVKLDYQLLERSVREGS